MGLGSVPGHDFDPRTRSFTEDELKPQPMIKKSRKQVNTVSNFLDNFIKFLHFFPPPT